MASTQYYMHMETQQCVCVPTEDGMDIYSSTQWVDNVHVAVAEVLMFHKIGEVSICNVVCIEKSY